MLFASSSGRTVSFPGRLFLAPMEGITDATFRGLVIGLGGVGGACTDFVRVAGAPVGVAALRRRLGPPPAACPVGLQLMASVADAYLSASAAAAEPAGAAFVDLNFGCPAPQVFNNCAGSALLAEPAAVAAIVSATVAATPLPVSAKLRVGIEDDRHLEELLLRVADAGAAAITLHARRRIDPYTRPARWEWIARAQATLDRAGHRLPLIGNGSVRDGADARRMRAETGCAAVMVGIGALADPFLFRRASGGPAATVTEAVDFVLRYAAAMASTGGSGSGRGGGRLKQLVRNYTAGDLFTAAERSTLLRVQTVGEVLDWFRVRASLES